MYWSSDIATFQGPGFLGLLDILPNHQATSENEEFLLPWYQNDAKKHGDLAGLAPTDWWETPSGTETLRLSIL